MAEKKKSPKASSKKNNNQAVKTTPKTEKTETEIVADKKTSNNSKTKQTKEIASAAKSKSAKVEKSSKDKSSKGKDGKKSGKFKQFFKDLKSEIKKIVWTSKEETLKNTGVVLLVVVIVGACIWLVDFGLTSLREFLYQLSNSSAEEARIMLSMMMSGLM